jgi:hypothetical protein
VARAESMFRLFPGIPYIIDMDDMMAIELIQPNPPPAPMAITRSESFADSGGESYVESAEIPESPLPYDTGTTIDLFA